MAQVINTNVASLNAQRNLSTSQTALNNSLQRLSSGLRINSAKDDAAGLAISDRFIAQINGLNQAARNANDGISLAQTAEGDLAQISNNLQRIRQLSVQSANATNSSNDRLALQKEVTQLSNEIDRVAKNSNFNDSKLLDGSFNSQLFQVGANAGQTITIDKITNAQKDNLGSVQFNGITTPLYPLFGDVQIVALRFYITDNNQNPPSSLGFPFEAFPIKAGSAEDVAQAFISTINDHLIDTGIFAQTTDQPGEISLSSIKANVSFTVQGLVPGLLTSNASPSHLSDIDISTQFGAQRAITIADAALTQVSAARADLGAIQNRFSSVVTSLQTSSENLSASRSRILDTDFAQETAALTRSQILQQAGTAMLAQANSLPNNVLTLLR